MEINTILDPSIKITPTVELVKLIKRCGLSQSDIPSNILKSLKQIDTKDPEIKLPSIEKYKQEQFKVDIKLYNSLLAVEHNSEDDSPSKTLESEDETKSSKLSDSQFDLSDLYWLNQFLKTLRSETDEEIYLHGILEKCTLKLPENEIVQRNPELEARCKKLQEQQQNRDYMLMTKNVDCVTRDLPEDTVAYQMKALNKQIIAVVQFVTSVIAGFVFGFLGIQLIVGDLDFGFRLLLGIMCALVIAIAEMYFLAKKLNEYDEISSADITQKVIKKPHFD